MRNETRNHSRRIIDTDWQTDPTAAERQPVRMPYQSDTSLFGGWGVKL